MRQQNLEKFIESQFSKRGIPKGSGKYEDYKVMITTFVQAVGDI